MATCKATPDQAEVHEYYREPVNVFQPCNYEGNQSPATKYCCDCEELLCTSCVTVHGKFKAFRHHRIVDKNDKEASSHDTDYLNVKKEVCGHHPTEQIKYECVSHKNFICGHCVVKEHQACKVNIISEVAKEFIEGTELRQLHDVLNSLSLECDQSKYQSEENVKHLEESCDKILGEIDEFYKEVSTFLSRKKEKLKLKVVELKERTQNDLINFGCECTTIQRNVGTLKAKCTTDNNRSAQLYIESVRARRKVDELKNRMTAAATLNRVEEIIFKKHPYTEDFMKYDHDLGSVCYRSGKCMVPVNTYLVH